MASSVGIAAYCVNANSLSNGRYRRYGLTAQAVRTTADKEANLIRINAEPPSGWMSGCSYKPAGRCLLASIALWLSACGIRVDDLGDHWNKGTVDPRLAGTWHILDPKSGNFSFVETGGMYRLIPVEKHRAKDEGWTKSLKVGDYTFFMWGPERTYTLASPVQGDLIRYFIQDNQLKLCDIRIDGMKLFLKDNYPGNHDIIVHKYSDAEHLKRLFLLDNIQIDQLNDRTLSILSAIPNDEDHWECGPVAERVPARKR